MESNTLLSIYKNNENFSLPNLEKIGLKKILFNKEIDNMLNMIKEKENGESQAEKVVQILHKAVMNL